MRALVTGGTGFIGRRLVYRLKEAGWDLCCLVRRPRIPVWAGLSVVQGDLLQADTLDLSPERIGPVDAVFHLAAMMPNDPAGDTALFMEANGVATERLLQACLRHGIDRFIYLSSPSVIGRPEKIPIDESHPIRPRSAYALGKLIGEMSCEIARNQGMKATAYRIGSPYGPGMPPNTVLPAFVRRCLDGKDLFWHGSGTRRQDFIHVDDIAAALILAATSAVAGTYCLGGGTSISMRALAELVASHRPGCKAGPSGQEDPQEGWIWQMDSSAVIRDLNFVPSIRLADGLGDYIATIGTCDVVWWA